MHHELLTGIVIHRIAAGGGCPIGIPQGCIVSERTNRPFSVGGAEILGEGSFCDGVKNAAIAAVTATWRRARERNLCRELIPVTRAWIGRRLGESDQGAGPNRGGDGRNRQQPAGKDDQREVFNGF